MMITCFEGQLILLLAFVVVEGADADAAATAGATAGANAAANATFPGAGIVFKRVPVAAVLVAGVRRGLLVVGPLGRVRLVLLVAAHAGGERKRQGEM